MTKPAPKKAPVKKPVKKKAPAKKAAPKKNPVGRPVELDPMKDGTLVCSMLVDGSSLRSITKKPGMPSRSTFFLWLAKYPELLNQYKIAIEMRGWALAEDIIDIADDASNDYMESNHPDNPGYITNGEVLSRSRLRVDSRKWIASKMLPKDYGDKIEIGGKLDVSTLSDEDIKAEIAALVGKEIATRLTDD